MAALADGSEGWDAMKHRASRSHRFAGRPRSGNGHRRRNRLLLALVMCSAVAAAAAFVSPAGPVTARLLGRLVAAGPSPSITSGPDGVFGGASSCSGLYFVSARGSGQPYDGATEMSVSPETDAVLTGIEDELKAKGVNPPIVEDQLGPGYQAQSVDVLWSGLSQNQTPKQMWDQLTEVDLPKYIDGEEDGEAELNGYLTEIAYDCYPTGHEPMIVLAGYSQGSMVVHNVLNALTANDATDYMSMIKGAVLIADPERMSFSDVLNLGTAAASDYGACHLADDIAPAPYEDACEPPGATIDVARYFSPVAFQVCNTGDIVCDTSNVYEKSDGFLRLQSAQTLYKRIKEGFSIHTSSYTPSELISVGRGIALNLIQDGLGTRRSPSPDPTSSSPSPDPTSSSPSPDPSSPSPNPTATTSTGSGTWTATGLSAPQDSTEVDGDDPMSISCPSSGNCVAVANYKEDGDVIPSLIVQSGSTWTPTYAPLPSDANSSASDSFASVACPSASECVAVGEYDGASGQEGLLVTGSGSSWNAATAPLPANAGSNPDVYLDSVACPSVSACTIAGTYTDSSGDQQGLLITESGVSWTATQMPMPSGGSFISGFGTSLNSDLDIACPSASACVVTGDYLDSADSEEGLLVTGSGASWTAMQMPVPSGGNDGMPVLFFWPPVACASASACVVVGTYKDSAGNSQDMFVTGSGTSWTATQMQVPTDSDVNNGLPSNSIDGIACPSASQCVTVVGFTGDGSQATVFTGLDASWTASNVPLPTMSGGLDEEGPTACGSAACATVVASDVTASSVNDAFILAGSGSSWPAYSVPLPGDNGETGAIYGIACTSASSCAAIGTYFDSSGNLQAMVITGSA
jgi:hypothetical protein